MRQPEDRRGKARPQRGDAEQGLPGAGRALQRRRHSLPGALSQGQGHGGGDRGRHFHLHAIDALNRECGSVQGYLRELGVGEKEIGEIRSTLLIEW